MRWKELRCLGTALRCSSTARRSLAQSRTFENSTGALQGDDGPAVAQEPAPAPKAPEKEEVGRGGILGVGPNVVAKCSACSACSACRACEILHEEYSGYSEGVLSCSVCWNMLEPTLLEDVRMEGRVNKWDSEKEPCTACLQSLLVQRHSNMGTCPKKLSRWLRAPCHQGFGFIMPAGKEEGGEVGKGCIRAGKISVARQTWLVLDRQASSSTGSSLWAARRRTQ